MAVTGGFSDVEMKKRSINIKHTPQKLEDNSWLDPFTPIYETDLPNCSK